MTAVLEPVALGAGLGMLAGRGPLCDALATHLSQDPHEFRPPPVTSADPVGDLDLQSALFACYELHYRGVGGVDDRWEWHPSVLALTAAMEAAFEGALLDAVPLVPIAPADVPTRLWELARAGGGPSLSAWTLEHGGVVHAVELAAHRSVYQLKEADPHTVAMRSITGEAKAAMVRIQHDEYGEGAAGGIHAALWADCLVAMGLDAAYGAYAHLVPATTLATNNLFSLLGLHRRLRGAVVGHLASFEMNSVGPMSRYSQWMDRLGYGDAVRRFYDVHVEADASHQHVAADELAAAFAADEPALAPWVPWGAQVLAHVEGRFAADVLDAWSAGRSSLLAPLG